jgi:Uma2 family endonuclease
MASVAEKLITAEEFLRMPPPPDGSRQELVRGVIVTMPPPGFRHGECQVTIAFLLKQYARSTLRGRVTVESGLVTERDPTTVRGPDVAYWSAERLPLDQDPEGYPGVAADLAVEVLSPEESLGSIHEKVREYFACGVRMVWVVHPKDCTVTVYRSPEQGQTLHPTATLPGEDVLPGFTCPVAELFT